MYTDEKIYAENAEIKDGLITLAQSLRPTHKVDLIFNADISLRSACRKIKHFDTQVHRKLVGKYFYKKPADQRIISICFPEHIDSNLHYHGVFRVPEQFHDKFQITAILAWLRVCQSGHLTISGLQNPSDIHQATNYCLKEIYKIQNYEHFVLSSEFWSSKIKSTPASSPFPQSVSKLV